MRIWKPSRMKSPQPCLNRIRRELGSRSRQLELFVVENESGTIQLEATTDVHR